MSIWFSLVGLTALTHSLKVLFFPLIFWGFVFSCFHNRGGYPPLCQRCWHGIHNRGCLPFMSAVLTWVSTGGWNYTQGVSKKWHTVILRSTGGWNGTHALSSKHGRFVMLRFMHACMNNKAIRRWLECTRWGTNQLCNAIALFYHCCATQLHCFIIVVQRICTV